MCWFYWIQCLRWGGLKCTLLYIPYRGNYLDMYFVLGRVGVEAVNDFCSCVIHGVIYPKKYCYTHNVSYIQWTALVMSTHHIMFLMIKLWERLNDLLYAFKYYVPHQGFTLNHTFLCTEFTAVSTMKEVYKEVVLSHIIDRLSLAYQIRTSSEKFITFPRVMLVSHFAPLPFVFFCCALNLLYQLTSSQVMGKESWLSSHTSVNPSISQSINLPHN